MLWFAPRRKGSKWSKSNKDRVARLIDAGLMMPSGLTQVEIAKRDGNWTGLDAVENLAVPTDLAEAFDAHPGSERNFDAFPRRVKRGILEWIAAAKRPATRERRIAEVASLAQGNERPKQFR